MALPFLPHIRSYLKFRISPLSHKRIRVTAPIIKFSSLNSFGEKRKTGPSVVKTQKMILILHLRKWRTAARAHIRSSDKITR